MQAVTSTVEQYTCLAGQVVVGWRACIANMKTVVVVARSGSKDAYRLDRSYRQADPKTRWISCICVLHL